VAGAASRTGFGAIVTGSAEGFGVATLGSGLPSRSRAPITGFGGSVMTTGSERAGFGLLRFSHSLQRIRPGSVQLPPST
jgi:hypothetical protein